MTKVCFLYFVDIDTVITDFPVGNIVESVNQVCDRCFSCSGRTDKGNLLPGFGKQCDVMKNQLSGDVAEIHMIHDNLAPLSSVFQLMCLLMLMSPRPDSRVFFAFCQCSVRILFCVDQPDISFVHFRSFIHQTKHTVRAGNGHDDGIQLHADLVDRHIEALVKGKKAGQSSDCHTADMKNGKNSSDNRAYHIADVSQLRVDRHQDIGKIIRGERAAVQLIVPSGKFLFNRFLVIKHLDDLFTCHHLFNIAVQASKVLLLLHKELPGQPSQLPGNQKHYDNHAHGHQCQRYIQNDHADRNADDGNGAVDKLGDTLADHLPQGVDIIGVHRHNVAAHMGVKIADRKRLHPLKQVVAQISQRPLRHIDIYFIVSKGTCHTNPVKNRDPCDREGKRPEIGLSRCRKHWRNIIIYQILNKQGSLYVGQYTDDNQHQNQNDMDSVFPVHILKQPVKSLPRILHR